MSGCSKVVILHGLAALGGGPARGNPLQPGRARPTRRSGSDRPRGEATQPWTQGPRRSRLSSILPIMPSQGPVVSDVGGDGREGSVTFSAASGVFAEASEGRRR